MGRVLGNQCECADPECPHTMGTVLHSTKPLKPVDCGKPAVTRLWRIDMEDIGGTLFCETCAEDAGESGLFTEKETEY